MGRTVRLGLLAALVLSAGLAAWWLLFLHSPAPATAFPLDLERVRALGRSLPGEGPAEVRFEDVTAIRFTEAMVMAGDAWRATTQPVYAWQLVYPDRTLVVDSAIDRATVRPAFLVDRFDDGAFARVTAAIEQASVVVVTHEHMDHIGGIAAHPRLRQILPRVALTAEQVANPGGMAPARLPADAMEGYRPLRYDDMLALAPGVVLIKAPGHTPGSQMVYVRRADGRELLFLGDVSWRARNIEQVRERPLFITLLIGEDRPAVLAQFRTLHELRATTPALAQVPGHDAAVVDALARAGLVQPGFRPPR
jgi:glyoxylase-like metal-dependent hydrolase (beta-lactamase superfamily II)